MKVDGFEWPSRIADATEEGRVTLQPDKMVSAVQAALERIPQVNRHASRIALEVQDGVLVMSGEVQDIIAKRLAHRAAIETLSVDRMLDLLRIMPAARRSLDAAAIVIRFGRSTRLCNRRASSSEARASCARCGETSRLT